MVGGQSDENLALINGYPVQSTKEACGENRGKRERREYKCERETQREAPARGGRGNGRYRYERATKKAEEQATRAHALLKRSHTSYATLDERFRSITASGQEGCVQPVFESSLKKDLKTLVRKLNKFSESKFDAKSKLHMLSELSYLHNCNNTLFLEARRHEDLYMWAVKSPNGPSIRMHAQNIHTMDELKMTGNCLKGSRGIVSFDAAFDQTAWGRLTKEVFTHVSCSSCCYPPRAIFLLGRGRNSHK